MILILAGPLACCPQEPGQVGNEAAILVYSSAEDKARHFHRWRVFFSWPPTDPTSLSDQSFRLIFFGVAMNSSLYLLFLITASTTVATPGPGVLMTLMKSVRFGFTGAKWTILGTAAGTIIMGVISATGIGVLLAHTPAAYNGLRILSAAYMIWLGIKNFRVKAIDLDSVIKNREKDQEKRPLMVKDPNAIYPFPFFMEGITLQMTNPLLIMFFLSLFPQFIDTTLPYVPQFVGFSATYFFLVIIIHSLYSLVTSHYRTLLKSQRMTQLIYRLGGTLFMLLAAMVLKSVIVELWFP